MVHDQVRDRERIWSFHLQASIDLIGSYVTSDFTSVPAAVAVVPYHRPLGALASIHFGVPKGKAGKPKIWRDSDWCELLADFYQVAARNTEHRKSDLRRFMARDRSFSDRNWFNKSSVRRNVNRALSPRHNKYLKLIRGSIAKTNIGR